MFCHFYFKIIIKKQFVNYIYFKKHASIASPETLENRLKIGEKRGSEY